MSLPYWVGHSQCVAICGYLLQIRTTWITAATMVTVGWTVNRVWLQQVAAARQRFRDIHMQNEILMTQGCLLQTLIQHTQKWWWTQGLTMLHQIAFLDTCESGYGHYYVWLIFICIHTKKGSALVIWCLSDMEWNKNIAVEYCRGSKWEFVGYSIHYADRVPLLSSTNSVFL